MSTLTVKELSHPAGEVIKIAAGKTLDLKSQGSVTMPTGSVIQVVTTRLTTQVTINTSSYVDVGGSLAITPKFANSLMYILFTSHIYHNESPANQWGRANFQILRDAVVVTGGDPVGGFGSAKHSSVSAMHIMHHYNNSYMDSPNTLNTIIYKPQISTVSTNVLLNNSTYSSGGSITIMEIAR